jgi:hypothetical protein
MDNGILLRGSYAHQIGGIHLIRAVWFVESGEDTPRFVTAYPLRRDADD